MGNSPTPRMMDSAFRALGLDAVYEALSVGPSDLASVFAGLKESGVAGLNVTLPHKTSIPRLLESLDEPSSRTRAVNTVKKEGTAYRGYNTDVIGIVGPLKSRGFGRIGGAAVLGTGGASRAFVAAMDELGCERLTAISRHPAGAQGFLSEMSAAFPDMDIGVVSIEERLSVRIELFFNASPCGSNSIPFPTRLAGVFDGAPLVFDAVYSPVETELIRLAKERRCQVIYGHEMLLHQGAEAVRVWTGVSPPLRAMKEALLASLEVPA